MLYGIHFDVCFSGTTNEIGNERETKRHIKRHSEPHKKEAKEEALLLVPQYEVSGQCFDAQIHRDVLHNPSVNGTALYLTVLS